MNKKSSFLIFFTVLAMLSFIIVSVSAQEIDVDSMDNAELMTLLHTIIQKLDQAEEAAATPEPTPTLTPVPAEIPQPELSDDTAELEALLMAIMQKLQQEKKTAAAPVSPAGTLVPVIDPESEPEYSIWENKKLQIESLPSYMFIQPTQAPKPEKPEHGGSKPTDGDSDHVPGTVCDPNFPDFCFWWPVDGEVVCVCGELG